MKPINFDNKLNPQQKVDRDHLGRRVVLATPKVLPRPLEKRYLYLSLLFLGIAFIIWILFFSDVFDVKNVSIRGDASAESLAVIENLKGRNIFLIGGKKAEKEIANKQPGIKSIKVLRGIPNTVIIELVERDPSIVWESSGKRYLVDKEGFLYMEGDSKQIRVVDDKNLPVKYGDRVVDSAFVLYVKKLNLDFPSLLGLEIDSIKISETTFQIQVFTKNGIVIKMDTTRDTPEQISSIKYVMDNNKDDSKQLIDVRIPGYAYIK